MPEIDPSCDIFNSFLSDNLLPYSLKETDGDLTILYNHGSVVPVNFNTAGLVSLKNKSIPANFLDNVWYPIFINSDEFVSNKVLSQNGALKNANQFLRSGRLGIENVINFEAQFKDWSVSNKSVMSIDWILNQPDIPYYLNYGIMGWFKTIGRDNTNTSQHIPYNTATLDKFPVGSRLRTDLLAGVTLIKIDDTTLYRTDRDNHAFEGNTWQHYNSSKLATLKTSSIAADNPKDILYYLSPESISESRVSIFNDLSQLWLADGDCFSYYDSFQDQQMQYASKIISKTYLSSALYKYYTQIYNIITSHKIKLMTSGMHLRDLRLAKKLAMTLSTSPFITDFYIHNLNRSDILAIIQNYIDNSLNRSISDTNTEIADLQKVLIQISELMPNDLNSISNKTLNNNLIFSKQSFFNKLNNKYGSALVIDSDTDMFFNKGLTYGDSIYLTQVSQSLCPKGLRGSAGSLLPVYNNQSISLNNINISTSLSTATSEILLRHNNESKLLPLADITKNLSYDIEINIVLDYISNVDPRFRTDNLDLRALNTDPSIAVYQYVVDSKDYSKGLEAKTSLSIITPRIVDANADIATEEQFTFLWEQIEGETKIYFDDKNISNDGEGKFPTSSHSNPAVYVSQAVTGGRFSVQCTISGPYGSFIKKKTFFVVQGAQREFARDGTPRNNPFYGQYLRYRATADGGAIPEWITPDVNENVLVRDSLPLGVRSDFLKVSKGILSEIAIDKGGIFWPLKTDLVYRTPAQLGSIKTSNTSLSGKLKFYFGDPSLPVSSANSPLSISYKPNNTIIKLLQIRLANVRNNNSDGVCSDCLSMYEPQLSASSSVVPNSRPLSFRQKTLRSSKNNDEIILSRFGANDDGSIGEATDTVSFPFPPISTNNSPPIKTYGGYSKKVLNDININIPYLKQPDDNTVNPTDIKSENPIIIPNITGYNLYEPMDSPRPDNLSKEQDLKLCYQKSLRQSGHVLFDKGVFHPASGWIRHSTDEFDQYKNLSSVLKFNPGARKSYSFTGPGLFGMQASYNRTTFDMSATTYTSEISLYVDGFVQWEPLCTCESQEGLVKEFRDNNQQSREYTDQYSGGPNSLHHGYRYLAGGRPKRAELRSARDQLVSDSVDEFQFTSSYKESDGVGAGYGVSYSYGFPVVGPNNPINNANITNKNFRNPRVNDFTIQDLEVKLNFLNVVNTKNIVVMFEANNDPPPADACLLKFNGNSFIDNTFNNSLFTDSSIKDCDHFAQDAPLANVMNAGLVAYVEQWLATHRSDSSINRLCLLNQEHIQHNKYNFSIKFSDHAPVNNVLYDQNMFMSRYQPNLYQNIVRDGYSITASKSAINHNDKDSAVYQNIIRTNKINMINNSFVKFKNHKLFVNTGRDSQGCGPDKPRQKGDSLSSSRSFVLKIIVLEELDDMRSFDLVNNNNLISGFDTYEVTQKSSDIVNSLCSWELILHTEKTHYYTASNGTSITNYGNNDVLGLIEYGSEPKYPGYGFIADFSDKKYLVPRVNVNAPHNYINDYAICDFVNIISKPTISRLRSPTFPTFAIISIVASLFQGTTGSLLGTATGPGTGYNQGFNDIINYFNQNRFIQSVEDTARNIYAPNYNNFPFGSAEKALLNISKTGGLWYKLEVPIFRYDNCPVLQHNKYKFVRLSKGSMPIFSEFNYDQISDIEQLLDTSLINNLSEETLKQLINNPSLETLISLQQIQNLSNEAIVKVTGSGESELDGIYIKVNGQLLSISNNWLNILKSKIVLTNNSLLSLFAYSASVGVNKTNANMVAIKGKIPFYIFTVDDAVEYHSDSSDTKTTIIRGKALIIKDNEYYTIFSTFDNISKFSTICHASNDTIVVFKPQSTKVSDLPLNTWGLEKEQLSYTSPEIIPSTTSLGSYGDGSIFKFKNYLTSNLQNNQLDNIYEIFNNHANDSKKHNDMTIITEEDKIIPISNYMGAIGYACSVEESRQLFVNNNYQLNNKDSDLISSLINTVGNIVDTKYQIIFIKSPAIKTALYNSVDINNSVDIKYGDITFEQDFITNASTNNLTQSDVDKISERLNALSVANTGIAKDVGNAQKTNNIILQGSIDDLISHYNALSSDPVSCYRSLGDHCPKSITKQAIYNRSYEKNILLKTIDSHSVASSGSTKYTAKNNNEYILPQVEVSVSQNADNSLSVNYTNKANNYYWINIDPKQSCSLAEDITVKVLKKTKYECRYANILLASVDRELIPNNNVCIARNLDIQSGDTEKINNISVGETEYVIDSRSVSEQKRSYEQQYSDIAGWKEYVITRQFMINNDAANSDAIPQEDIAVTATETYDIALPCFMTPAGIKSCQDSHNDGSADVNYVQGNHPESQKPCDFSEIPEGSGLLNDIGQRIPFPSRVYNIFNLDDINNLMVQFRKIPRQIRGLDYYTTVYKYGSNGSVFRPSSTVLAPLELTVSETLNNNFYYWHCLQGNEDRKAVETQPSNFLIAQNEMTFRAFFGSVDGIENKDNLTSLFSWEMIPYEYHT